MINLSRRHFLAALSASATFTAMSGLPLSSLATPLSQAGELPTLDSVDKIAREYLSETAPGVSVSVSHKGVPVHCAGYGLANVEHNVPVHADTMFQTGSVGKMFTATLVLLLQRDGLLDIDAPMSNYFDDMPTRLAKLTPHHLLNHVGGLTNYDGIIDISKNFTDDELVSEIYKLGSDFAPEDKWDYCNTGYMLLGLLTTRVGGEHYGELLAKRIFAPAGMKTARIIAPESDVVPNRAAGYNVNDDGKLANQWYASSTFLRTGDGAIYVSARDMVTWGLALRNNKILSADEYRLLTTASPQSLNDESGGYGMGMSLSKSGPHTIHAHGGSWQGFLSYFMRVVDEDVIVSINANSSGYRTEEAAHKIASLWAPQLDRL